MLKSQVEGVVERPERGVYAASRRQILRGWNGSNAEAA